MNYPFSIKKQSHTHPHSLLNGSSDWERKHTRRDVVFHSTPPEHFSFQPFILIFVPSYTFLSFTLPVLYYSMMSSVFPTEDKKIIQFCFHGAILSILNCHAALSLDNYKFYTLMVIIFSHYVNPSVRLCY